MFKKAFHSISKIATPINAAYTAWITISAIIVFCYQHIYRLLTHYSQTLQLNLLSYGAIMTQIVLILMITLVVIVIISLVRNKRTLNNGVYVDRWNNKFCPACDIPLKPTPSFGYKCPKCKERFN